MKELNFRTKRDPVFVMRVNILPRGSGNRGIAQRIAANWRAEERLKAHTLRIITGSSSVVVHLRPSFALWSLMQQMVAEHNAKQAEADPDQLSLFGMPAVA